MAPRKIILRPGGKAGKAKAPRALKGEVLPAESDLDEAPGDSQDGPEGTSEDEPDPDAAPAPFEGDAPSLPVPDLAAPGLAATDPLRQYMREVGRYALLAPEEEHALALRFRETGDPEIARQLVTANLRLVVKIAFEYRTLYANLLDLIQEGNVGLMKAVAKFDPSKGARLGYYASWWIRSYILKYLLDNFRLVKVGTTQAQKKLFYHLMREKQRLEAQGLLAGPKLLAQKLDVREKDVREMEHRLSGSGAEFSIDAPIRGSGSDSGSSASHAEFLRSDAEGADDALARAQLLEMIQDRLPQFRETLNARELQILTERILADEPKTLQEVADQYGLTRERVRQVETKVVAKLRDFLKWDKDGED